MYLNKKIRISIVLYFTLSITFLLIMYLFASYLRTLSPLLEYDCIFLIVTLVLAIKQFGIFSIFTLFLVTSFFFLYDCLFFTVFGVFDFLYQTFPTEFSISVEVGHLFLISIFLFVLVSYICYSFFCCNKYKKYDFPKKSLRVYFFGKIIFFTFLIPALIKIYIQIKYLKSAGYVAIFLGGLKDIDYPFFCTGAISFFTMGYCLILCSIPTRKQYLFFTSVFSFVYILNAIKGQRGPSIAIFLISIFIYTKYYGVKISLKKIMVLVIVILVLIISLEKIRSNYGNKNNKKNSVSITRMISNVLYYQTTSRAVPLLVMQGNLPYHKYPFVFSPLFKHYYEYKYGANFTKESAMNFNNISQVTMASISMNSHLKGLGYGGAVIAEAYDFFGLFGVILFAIFLARCAYWIDCMTIRVNRYGLIVMYFVLVNFMTLARGRLFDFLAFDQEILCTFIVLSLIQCNPKRVSIK